MAKVDEVRYEDSSSGAYIHATILAEPGPIPLSDFSEFLLLYRAAYAAAVETVVAVGDPMGEVTDSSVERLVARTRGLLERLSKSDIDRLASRPLASEPAIDAINRENPIVTVLVGLGIAFAAATILSGGRFRLTGTSIEVEIPPLGHGISELRKALRRKAR